ncbi:MAG: DUF202 domain-containing protein [Deltaproteobacteria bacterium]|nr:DUF202 domain-containing protein [Deltaproteobacteria bacterium]
MNAPFWPTSGPFWRTALTLFIAGLTFLKFFEDRLLQVIGWVFLPTEVMVFLQGVRMYRRIGQIIRRAEDTVQQESSPAEPEGCRGTDGGVGCDEPRGN